ncbi:UNVERIFIED_CONTAM: hypothetical protein K2H54_024818 [Gekko kuhli]
MSGRKKLLPWLCNYRAAAQHQQESPQGEQEANRSHGDQPEPLAEKQQLECLEGVVLSGVVFSGVGLLGLEVLAAVTVLAAGAASSLGVGAVSAFPAIKFFRTVFTGKMTSAESTEEKREPGSGAPNVFGFTC